jgi:hypothetical protein
MTPLMTGAAGCGGGTEVMSFDGVIPEPYSVSLRPAEGKLPTSDSGFTAIAPAMPPTWLIRAGFAVQLLAVAVGCALAAVLPADWIYRIPGVVIPLIFVVIAHPNIQSRLYQGVQHIAVRTGGRGSRQPDVVANRGPVGVITERPIWAGNAPNNAAFLRSFNQLEEILQEALVLQVGEIATEFALRDMVEHLEQTGFLTLADRDRWADCLSVRRSLLMTGPGRPMPSAEEVESSLAKMLQLQVQLIDRRRKLFYEEQEIRERENAALQVAAGKMN